MIIKRSDIVNLWNLLNGDLANVSGPVKFIHFFAKLKVIIKPEIEALYEISHRYSASFEYQEYDKKRLEVCKQYAELNEDGSFQEKIENKLRKFIFTSENEKIVNKKIEELAIEYSDAIKKHQKAIDDIDAFYKENIEINLPTLDLNIIPDNALTLKQLEYFLSLKLIEE